MENGVQDIVCPSSPLTGLAPVTVGVDVLAEGEQDPGVGKPWAPTGGYCYIISVS